MIQLTLYDFEFGAKADIEMLKEEGIEKWTNGFQWNIVNTILPLEKHTGIQFEKHTGVQFMKHSGTQ